jgi:hypothetical protein
MANEIEIGVTKIENIIEITSQPTDQVVDIGVTDNADNVVLNITPSVIEININRGTTTAGLVTSVNNRIGDVVIDANDVGLGNVDDTGDFQKPISNDTQVALNSKADLIDGIVPDNQLPVTTLSIMSGLSQGGVMTINTDTAKFDVTAGFGYIVNGHTNPDVPIKTRVAFAGSTANVIPNIGTTKQTFVSIDINGALNLTPNPLTPTERRNFIRLGVLIHLDNTNIIFIDNQPTVNIEVGGQLQDLLEAFGFRSLSGNRIFPVGANLKIKKELGKLFKSGANFKNLITQPHSFTSDAQDPITFKYRTQTGAEGSNITDINPTIYDNNGTITAMPATATLASIQRIFIFQDDTIRIQPGQKFFNNLNEAVTAINSDVFVTDVDISENALYLGAIVMIRGTTALNNLAQAIFVPATGVSANGSTSAAPLGYTAEDSGNKQNSLAVDGTAAKYPTVDAINASVVKLTGNQQIQGVKTFRTNSPSGLILDVDQNSGNAGMTINQRSAGGATFGINASNFNSGDAITVNNYSSGNAFVANQLPSGGTGFNYIGKNNSVNTYTVSKEGAAIFGSSVTANDTLYVKNLNPKISIENLNSSLVLGQTIGDIDFYQNDISTGGIGVVSRIRSINENAFAGQAGLSFFTGTNTTLTERTRINSLGNLLIGTTTDNGSKLQVSGAATFTSSVTATSHITTGGLATQLVKGNGGLTVGYKVYTALLSQSGTDAPVPIILENTLGAVIVWSRLTSGIYNGTLSGAFTNNKTFFSFSGNLGAQNNIDNVRLSDNIVRIVTYQGSSNDDNILKGSYEIRVYN